MVKLSMEEFRKRVLKDQMKRQALSAEFDHYIRIRIAHHLHKIRYYRSIIAY